MKILKTSLIALLVVLFCTGNILWAKEMPSAPNITELNKKIEEARDAISSMENDRDYMKELYQKLDNGEYVYIGGLVPVPKGYVTNRLGGLVAFGIITQEDAIRRSKRIGKMTKDYKDAIGVEIKVVEADIEKARKDLVSLLDQRAALINNETRPSGGSTSGAVWDLIETITDPMKLAGQAIGGGNICDVMTPTNCTVTNKDVKATSTVDAGAPPQTISGPFDIEVSVNCNIEKGDYCCIEAGVSPGPLNMTPNTRVGKCGKPVKESQTYTLTPPGPEIKEFTITVYVGAVGSMGDYKYKKRGN